jgi:capsular polysaccharide biosynthesis protein
MFRLASLRLLESYFRHRWLYLLPIALMTVAAACAFVLAKPVYISRSVLYVQKESFLASLTSIRDTDFTWVTPAQATVNECQELLQTDSFIRSIVLQTDRESDMSQGPSVVEETIEWAREAVWVETLGDNLVMIAAADEIPELAQQLVNGTVETFIRWRIQQDREGSVAAQAFFAGLIDTYEAAVEIAHQDIERYLLDHPLPVRGDRSEAEVLQIQRLQAALDLTSTRLANALNKEEEARLGLTQAESDVRQTYLLLDAPRLPAEPELSLKRVLINSLLFVATGVILSGVGVVAGALLDRSFRFPIDVRHGLDLPVLATVPAPTQGRRKRPKATRAKKGAQTPKNRTATETEAA